MENSRKEGKCCENFQHVYLGFLKEDWSHGSLVPMMFDYTLFCVSVLF